MDKTRIIGLAIFMLGIVIKFVVEIDAADFISGILIGSGIGLLLTGKLGKAAR